MRLSQKIVFIALTIAFIAGNQVMDQQWERISQQTGEIDTLKDMLVNAEAVLSRTKAKLDKMDRDGDGFPNLESGGKDCNDTDATIHPYADDICEDAIDQDCFQGDMTCKEKEEIQDLWNDLQ